MKSSDWLPMETAPKNAAGEFYGQVILVWDRSTDQPWPVQWAQGGPDNAGCWRVLNDWADDPAHNEIWPDDALAWMPIAAPWKKETDNAD